MIEKEKKKSACEWLLNKDDLNLWGHTAGLRGDKSDKCPIVGRSFEAAETETMCVVLHTDRWCETAG